jgi:hypothetical protein
MIEGKVNWIQIHIKGTTCGNNIYITKIIYSKTVERHKVKGHVTKDKLDL